MITTFLTSRWTGFAAMAATLILAVLLISAKSDVRRLETANTTLTKKNTQLVANLAQARTNQATLKTALDQVNDQLRSLAAQSQAKIAALGKQVEVANGKTVTAQRRARDIIAYQPKGNTEGERMLDVDRELMESLK